jgi:GNAT superfamily N-acetyltransferase
MCVSVREVSFGRRPGFGDFLRVPRRIYDGHSPWIAPLDHEIKRKLNPARNAFFRYGELTMFVAYDEAGRPCGRAAAIVNPWHRKLHKERTGFFGLFESLNNPKTAQALLQSVTDILVRAGCDRVLGPVNLTTNDESGFLFEGYDEPPTFMCNYCPSYYHSLMSACGFHKAIDTLSYMARHGHTFPEKYYRIVKRLEGNPRIAIRRFRKAAAKDDILDIADIYNKSFRETWGFVPMSQDEAIELGQSLTPIADYDLIWIASFDGKPVGAILGFPDINEILGKLDGRLFPFGFLKLAFGRKKIQGMRIAALGVLPGFRNRGIETILIHKVHERVHTRPYLRSEFSVVLEKNLAMRNLLERFGFTPCRRFRLYTKEITSDL